MGHPQVESRFGPAATTTAPALVAGSSLVVFGVDWDRVGRVLNRSVELRGVPSASPCELEGLQRQVPQATLTFLGVSPFDLNEHFVGDFRSECVPFTQAVSDLWHSGADWAFTKRVLSQYPLRFLRLLFPTAGRSLGVMVGLREKARKILRPNSAASESGPTMGASTDPHAKERISDWPSDRTLRNLAQMRGSCLGRQAFDGPKQLALGRMISQAAQQGRAVVLVLPVSAAYAREFLKPEAAAQFAEAIRRMQSAHPEAQWVRLDQLPELQSEDLFWDLVHLNAEGKRRATDFLLAQLESSASQR